MRRKHSTASKKCAFWQRADPPEETRAEPAVGRVMDQRLIMRYLVAIAKRF